ncbi:TetR/AcrR family transcriptional regulator [Alsobacter sp. SYSU M60028]|uniref:TetR/AcrR family transcriptional regulator n=1 Tax=Alsobacter ponti TaxID=2962936 RepID=A0ABT1L808_9HYPH|nr:TetR/AcrR family transcriptional regulator [Alsobacter ponti]MCP8937637.1 TetR/AcrR family transcriptional regulator [Alsobacter ponti]
MAREDGAEERRDGDPSERLGRADWIAAARATLIEQGVAAVKVDALARRLGVTRGSFYWHFKSRDALLSALREEWRRSTVAPFAEALESDRDRPAVQLLRFCRVWLDEKRYDPRFDAALRDWARSAPEVDRLVRAADDERLDMLRGLFARLGYEAREAEARARILYYHQVGHYALHIVEPAALRRELLPHYFRVLAGFPIPPDADCGPKASVEEDRRGG